MKRKRGRQCREERSIVRSQGGFSLVELIIAIAIMGILAGSTIGFINHIRLANTRKAAKEIGASINRLQTTSMSKVERPTLYIYKVDGDYYMCSLTDTQVGGDLSAVLTPANGMKIGNGSIVISGEKSGAAVGLTGNTSDTCIKVTYRRDGLFDTNTAKTNVDKIQVSGTSSYTITLLASTGKYLLD